MTPAASPRPSEIIESARRDRSRQLDLSGQGLRSVPDLPADLQGLRSLDLSRNRLADLPASLWQLSNLERLDLGGNRLTALPAAVGTMAGLVSLDLSENRLSDLPAELRSCTSLAQLDLFNNQLTAIAPAGSIPSLRKLDVSRNRVRELPGFDRAVNLEDLDLSYNQIEALPPGLGSLPRLRRLDLSGNRLRSVAELAGLSLQELHLDENLLAQPPLELTAVESLRIFSADGNPFGALPAAFERVSNAELRERARAAIQAHISGGPAPGTRYFNAATFFFNFFLAVGGFTGATGLIDLYYKRFASCSAVLKFPDGSSVELNNLTRKAALEIADRKQASLERGHVLLDVKDTSEQSELQAKSSLILQAISRLGNSQLVPKTAGDPVIQFINIKEVDMGDQISIGSITGSNVNIKSNLENVRQSIGAAAGVDSSTKAQLDQLMKQLSEALEKVPAEKKEDAEAVADAATDLVGKAIKDKPNKKSVEISANGLLEAAKGIAGVVPIAIEIAKTVGGFIAGLPF